MASDLFNSFKNTEHLAHAPGLGKAALTFRRVVTVINLRQLAQTSLPQHSRQRHKLLPDPFCGFRSISVYLQVRKVIGTQRENPGGSLMIGHITLHLGAAVAAVVLGVLGGYPVYGTSFSLPPHHRSRSGLPYIQTSGL